MWVCSISFTIIIGERTDKPNVVKKNLKECVFFYFALCATCTFSFDL